VIESINSFFKKKKPKVKNNTNKAPSTVYAGDIEVSKLKQF